MSLTSFLGIKEVKRVFSRVFSLPPFTAKPPMMAPPVTTNYGMVGTAFDYLMRFYLEKINPKTITHRWVAEEAVNLSQTIFPDHFEKANELLENAKKVYLDYRNSGVLTDDLIISSVHLAQLDPIFRAAVLDPNMGSVENGDIEDLKNLINAMDPAIFTAKKICILNPTFGEGSHLVSGADGDFLIDKTLVDIKTTKNLQLKPDHFYQLIGYYILSEIGGIDNAPSGLKIEKVGIYFSRHGFLYTLPIKPIIEQVNFPKFVDWFKKLAEMVFHKE